ncbi:MAG: hypothetical protein FIB08_14640 [Candidatus Methanoperedens sp.]|nr:hypothetical protein [Candidatus Methanoperedens sp.]
MRKCIILNTLKLTSKKQDIIDNLFSEYLHVLNTTLDKLPCARSSLELHHLTYSTIRESSFLPSDIVEEASTDTQERKAVKQLYLGQDVAKRQNWYLERRAIVTNREL